MRRCNAITLAPHAKRLTTKEAADLLGISRPTLIKRLETGKIPFKTPKRHRRLKLLDLLSYQQGRHRERENASRQFANSLEKLKSSAATGTPLRNSRTSSLKLERNLRRASVRCRS